MSAALDGTILTLNKSGEKLMSATAAAVTGRKLAEARLQDANERLQLATEAANMGPTPKS